MTKPISGMPLHYPRTSIGQAPAKYIRDTVPRKYLGFRQPRSAQILRQPPSTSPPQMNQIPDVLYADQDFTTWLIVGASRGIGLEFVRQLLNRSERIIATVREPWASHASGLWGQAGSDHGRCQMYVCDILSEDSIIVCCCCSNRRVVVVSTPRYKGTDRLQKFVAQLAAIPNLKIDYVVLNAGVLRYPNVSYRHSLLGAALILVESD